MAVIDLYILSLLDMLYSSHDRIAATECVDLGSPPWPRDEKLQHYLRRNVDACRRLLKQRNSKLGPPNICAVTRMVNVARAIHGHTVAAKIQHGRRYLASLQA